MGIIVGEGGMPIDTYWHCTSMRMISIWAEGVERRTRSIWEVGRVLARVQASAAGCKNLGDDFPYRLPWDRSNEEDDGLTEAQRRAEMERMLPEIEASLRKTIEQNNKTE